MGTLRCGQKVGVNLINGVIVRDHPCEMEGQSSSPLQELLAEAAELPHPKRRSVAAILGALVADAACEH